MRRAVLYRQNGIGLKFSLSVTENNGTRISYLGKHIEVKFPIEEVSSCWYNWQMKGMLIQDAFPYFDANEREFLISGITDSEWDKMFEKYKED